MSEPTSRFEEIFFAVFESLPRQGPGSRACTARALELCGALPPSPRVLDLGCGVGAQTLHLAELTAGTIVAVDCHAPSVERLHAKAQERGLGRRVRALVGDMAHLPLSPSAFDLVWSEGALYNLGLARALGICRDLLRAGGRLGFTDAVWREADPPAEVRAMFEDYPTMGSVSDVVDRIQASGLALLGHFTLPDEAWWDGFYTPMLRRIEALRAEYSNDAEALSALDRIAAEPELHREHGRSYAYEFFVARRP